ncbi:hypothetical protein [Actinophytocola sp.]|uniref:hypothetical protein n=1 Tax=Actinophytocola sp. TaxID=1872138 RepID=UPI002ED35307
MNEHGRPPESFLRTELRRLAGEHEPDRAAMLNRIAANRASRARVRGQTVRLAAAAVAVTTVLGLGWVVTRGLADDDTPAVAPPASMPNTTGLTGPSPSASTFLPGIPAPSSTLTSVPPSSSAPTSSEVRGHPGDTKVEKGSLWSEGSTDGGTSTVTLKAQADLTTLDLTIRLVLTPGLAEQGSTHDVTTGVITASVERRSDALLYHFTLRQSATLPAGTYMFTARYSHDGASRDVGEDTYEAFGDDADHRRVHVYGNFLGQPR